MLAFTASNHRGLFVDVLLSFWVFFFCYLVSSFILSSLWFGLVLVVYL